MNARSSCNSAPSSWPCQAACSHGVVADQVGRLGVDLDVEFVDLRADHGLVFERSNLGPTANVNPLATIAVGAAE